MDLNPYVDTLRHEVAVAARSAGPDAESLAERLTAPLESATRLVLQEAISDAAQEISRDLAPGSVDVRLRGRDLGFVVDRGPRDRDAFGADTPAWPPASPDVAPGVAPSTPQDTAGGREGEAGTARITVRLPETLKSQVEAAAEREGVSVNAYLVRTLGAALQPGGPPNAPTASSDWPQTGSRLSGWVQ